MAGMGLLFLLVAVGIGADLLEDRTHGADLGHLLLESAATLAALGGAAWAWSRAWRDRAAAVQARRQAERDLDLARAEATRWRKEAADALAGLSRAIDQQFERWSLTPAEREVGLLLLKGLSLQQVAELRGVSERTVRQQASTIYTKSGLAGRAELSAFFLEDLMLPAAPVDRSPRLG